ncbi:hypothetical protein AVEN_190073-1 [Araneus ventricosus]|uniref:Secreted protein n=1 Tax=Araneus ventricosus TaxID=182803 RepID=A0A4Y2JSH2_ARAVE|nr:hypothetical protein AVEN_190073-1 [Araneus ventricosus]
MFIYLSCFCHFILKLSACVCPYLAALSTRSERPRWPRGKVSTVGSQAPNPIPPKIRHAWGLLHAKSYVVAKRPPVGVAWKFGEGVPAQVSSLSSDRGSK